MPSNETMKTAYNNLIRSVRLGIATLIACLVMLFSEKSTASSTIVQDDSSRTAQPVRRVVHPLDPKPIRMSEAGARQALKDRADLLMLQGVVASQDTLLAQQRKAISTQGQTIQQLNERQQQAQNAGQTAQAQAERYRKKLRGARLENWLMRGAVVLYVAVRFKLI